MVWLAILVACTGGGDTDTDVPDGIETDVVDTDAVDTDVVDTDGVDTDGVDTDDTDDTDTPPDFGSAVLRVVSPSPGEYLMLEEPQVFEATLVDSAGEALPFTDVTWSSSGDGAWAPVGLVVDDAPLGAGEHDVTARAVLPNGDHHAYVVGGLRVQSVYTGSYEGDVRFGTHGGAYDCATGAATYGVDRSGERLTGEGACTMSGTSPDAEIGLAFDLDNLAGVLSGVVTLSVDGAVVADLPAEGEIDAWGWARFTFEDTLAGYDQVAGRVTALRVSVDPP